jgi:hypothetical protein
MGAGCVKEPKELTRAGDGMGCSGGGAGFSDSSPIRDVDGGTCSISRSGSCIFTVGLSTSIAVAMALASQEGRSANHVGRFYADVRKRFVPDTGLM